MLSPLEEERSELGYKLVEVRDGRQLRVVHRQCEASDVCLFFVHGGGGRAGQFKHLIKAFQSTYVYSSVVLRTPVKSRVICKRILVFQFISRSGSLEYK